MSPGCTIHIPDAMQPEYEALLRDKTAAVKHRADVADEWEAAKAFHTAAQRKATAAVSSTTRRIGSFLARAQAVQPEPATE